MAAGLADYILPYQYVIFLSYHEHMTFTKLKPMDDNFFIEADGKDGSRHSRLFCLPCLRSSTLMSGDTKNKMNKILNK